MHSVSMGICRNCPLRRARKRRRPILEPGPTVLNSDMYVMIAKLPVPIFSAG